MAFLLTQLAVFWSMRLSIQLVIDDVMSLMIMTEKSVMITPDMKSMFVVWLTCSWMCASAAGRDEAAAATAPMTDAVEALGLGSGRGFRRLDCFPLLLDGAGS